MFESHFGEFTALLTAALWAITSLAFERASKRIGSLLVNLFRLILGFVFLSVYCFFSRGLAFPTDATAYQWFWLSLSSIAGFVIGDTFLLKAFVKIGARISQLFMALAPPIAGIFGWLVLGEHFTLKWLLGMSITILGIAMVVLQRQTNDETVEGGSNGNRLKMKFKYPLIGLLFAIGGAAGQAIGIVLSKLGMGVSEPYDPFAASQIRVFVGAIAFFIIFLFSRRWKEYKAAIGDKVSLMGVLIGTITGPFLGVSFSLLSVQHTTAGTASTIMALTPVLIIIPSHFIFKEKISFKEIVGAIISFCGVAIFFM